MRRVRAWVGGGAAAGLLALAPAGPSQTRERPAAPVPSPTVVGTVPTAPPPRLVPVAETKLVCEGVGKANFQGLARAFRDKPADADGWAFARGQALLVAETGNLLLIRPPKTKTAQDVWVPRAVDLRDAGTRLARAAGVKDVAASRAGLAAVANACNRCHEGFRVAERVDPTGGPPDARGDGPGS